MTLKHVAVLLASVLLFLWGAERQARLVNSDMHSTDQSAYMEYAKNLAQTDFKYVGGRNRMPLYPIVMALFYRDGMSDEEFFAIGKHIGIAIGLVVLTIVFFVFKSQARTLDALTGMLVAMFTVFAYKSPYFQADVLFYGINFLLFVLLLLLLQKPRVTTAALAGLTGAIAHLTKASVIPGILLCAASLSVRSIVEFYVTSYGRSTSRRLMPLLKIKLDSPLCCIATLLGVFLLAVFPYIRTSKAIFGQYFYNVNSTFYIWYDSWEEVVRGTRAHGDRVGWPVMPTEEIPSFHKYLWNHNFSDAITRFAGGLRTVLARAIESYGYVEFVVIYFGGLILFATANRSSAGFFLVLSPTKTAVLVFIPAYFIGYLSLYAWYTPIASGNRFVLALFLPLMLLMIRILSFVRDNNMTISLFGKKVYASSISPAILVCLCFYILFIFPQRISSMYGGD